MKGRKQLLSIYILEILRKYSDPMHRLSVQKIMRYLQSDYAFEADRRTVRDHLLRMKAAGLAVDHDVRERVKQNGDVMVVSANWYLEPSFSETEIRYLVDSILFSRHMSPHYKEEIIEKIKNLGTVYQKSMDQTVLTPQMKAQAPAEFFLNLEIINEAIAENKQVAFHYIDIRPDMNEELRLHDDGRTRVYRMNPYHIVAAQAHYYLIGNMHGKEGLSQYRVDRMRDVRLLRETIRPVAEDFTLPKHMAEHIYMFSGPSVHCTFTAPVSAMQQLIDWFGYEMEVLSTEDEMMTVAVDVNAQAMLHWALQYGKDVTILSPLSLVKEMRKVLSNMSKRYKTVYREMNQVKEETNLDE